jgi:hypothetical protein
MRTKFYGALVTFGLVATALVKTGHAEIPQRIAPRTELVIDTTLHPMQFNLQFNEQPDPIADLADVMDVNRDDSIGLNFALASPGILFGSSPHFVTLAVHFGPGATTAVVFRTLRP